MKKNRKEFTHREFFNLLYIPLGLGVRVDRELTRRSPLRLVILAAVSLGSVVILVDES